MIQENMSLKDEMNNGEKRERERERGKKKTDAIINNIGEEKGRNRQPALDAKRPKFDENSTYLYFFILINFF